MLEYVVLCQFDMILVHVNMCRWKRMCIGVCTYVKEQNEMKNDKFFLTITEMKENINYYCRFNWNKVL